MPVTLSIKNVPDEIAQRLRERAARNHRSLQGELMAIIGSAAIATRKTPMEILAEVERLGIESPADSVDMIREDRDAR